MNGSPMSTGDVPSTIHEMRRSDRSAVRRPLLCVQARIMGDTQHWSVTHDWPTVCDQMVELGLVSVVANPGWPFHRITEITSLGRDVRAALARTEEAGQ